MPAVLEAEPSVGPEVKSKSWIPWPFGRSAATKEGTAAGRARKSEKSLPPIVEVKSPEPPIVLPKIPEPRVLPETVKGNSPPLPSPVSPPPVSPVKRRG